MRKTNPWIHLLIGQTISQASTEHFLKNPEVKSLIDSDKQFDLILGEIILIESLFAGLSQKFKAPIVAFAPTMPNYYTNYLVSQQAIIYSSI